MARVSALLPYQWRAYWRGIRSRGIMAGANLTMVILFAALMLPLHIGTCVSAAVALRRDPGGLGPLLAEASFLGILTAWLFVPMLVSSVQTRGQGIAPERLLHLPFSSRQLFLAGVGGAFVQPLYWILLAASLVSLVPLAFAPNPLAGTVAALLYLAACALLSWAIGLLGAAIFSTRRAREVALVAITFFFLGFIFLARLDIESENGGFYLHGMGDPVLLVSETGGEGLVVAIRDWTPASWVVRAAVGDGTGLAIGLVALLALVSLVLTRWSFARALKHPVVGFGGGGKRRRAIGGLPGMPAPIGAATRKEMRYLSRTLDMILGLAVSGGVAIYVLVAGEPLIYAPVLGAAFYIFSESVMPLNAFGLDRAGADRYRLLPLTGAQVLLAKNLAYLLLVAAQTLPIALAASLRFSPALGVAIILGALSYCFLGILLGNALSVRAPAPREFFNFESKEQTGGILPLLYMAIVWLLPFGLGAATWPAGGFALVLGQLVLLGILAAVYRSRLPAAGRRFDASAETMRQRLAG